VTLPNAATLAYRWRLAEIEDPEAVLIRLVEHLVDVSDAAGSKIYSGENYAHRSPMTDFWKGIYLTANEALDIALDRC